MDLKKSPPTNQKLVRYQGRSFNAFYVFNLFLIFLLSIGIYFLAFTSGNALRKASRNLTDQNLVLPARLFIFMLYLFAALFILFSLVQLQLSAAKKLKNIIAMALCASTIFTIGFFLSRTTIGPNSIFSGAFFLHEFPENTKQEILNGFDTYKTLNKLVIWLLLGNTLLMAACLLLWPVRVIIVGKPHF